MATVTIAPSLPQIYFNEARFELLKLSRNRSYLFSMVGFPVIFYLLFGVTNRGVSLSWPYDRALPSGRILMLWRDGLLPLRHRRWAGVRARTRVAGNEARQPHARRCLSAGKAVRQHYFCGRHHHSADDTGDRHGRRPDHDRRRPEG